MRLNRYNYEEFFILYMDNELDAEGRREVEIFVQQNPDLKDELDILLQSKLTPDTDISFADKGSLLRFDSSSISLANYEEWLTSYIDNELTEDERKSVEEFVAHHPAAQKELNLLQQAKLKPERIVFPHKESLYRTAEKARVISIRWMRIAVAAVLLLAFGTTTVVLLNNKDNSNSNTNGPVIAQANPGKAKVNNTSQPAKGTETNEITSLPGNKKNDESNGYEARVSNPAVKQPKNENVNTEQVIKDEIVDNTRKEDKIIEPPLSNETVNSSKNEPINANAENNGAITTIDASVKSEPTIVTKPPVDSYNIQNGPVKQDDNAGAEIASNDNGGNKGLRGFFRKVTRTIEKRTNIKATDDDDRLLIAGLAIKMN